MNLCFLDILRADRRDKNNKALFEIGTCRHDAFKQVDMQVVGASIRCYWQCTKYLSKYLKKYLAVMSLHYNLIFSNFNYLPRRWGSEKLKKEGGSMVQGRVFLGGGGGAGTFPI